MSVILNSPNVVIGHMSGGTININNNAAPEPAKKTQPACEDIEPVENSFSAPNVKSEIDSIIFTKKSKKEGKIPDIIEALQKSVHRRKDKTRAFVDELHSWQDDGYVDAHYNAKVMYDELEKLMPLSFGYDAFKRQYNYTRV